MKKLALSALAIIPALSGFAQSPVDAMSLSQTELRGTAKFMSMGGAFTALGADLSAIQQNPAGIGMYRGSDIGLTLGVDIGSNKTEWDSGSNSQSTTVANLNNAGYVGTCLFGNNNENSISWGFTYNRLYRFNRTYTGGMSGMETSATNYIASITNGVDPSSLWSVGSNGQELYPYDNYSSDAPDWMSVLLYNSGMINPETVESNGDVYETDQYRGLWQHGGVDALGNKIDPSTGSADFLIREKGYADEYNFTLGGSISNLLYWGVGVGITDLDYTKEYYYTEYIDNALIPASPAGYRLGTDNYSQMYSYSKITGTGANFKIGVILKPINEFRFGIAVHTPTYYSLDCSSYGSTDFKFTTSNDAAYRFQGSETTPWDDYSFKLNTPWKLMVGAAGVIGGRAIISLDYQYDAYNDIKLKDYDGFELTNANDNIAYYYKGTNTIRIGAEYRITPQFSVRAGYNTSTTNAGKDFKDANKEGSYMEVSTAGSNLSYEVSNATNYVSCGLGYKVNGFYFDLTYVYKHRSSTLNAFSSFVDYDNVWSGAPTAKLTDNKSQIVATLGYRF
jgi:hypothetical protein